MTVYNSIAGRAIPENISDTIQLASATVIGYAPERFLAGQKYRKIDTSTVRQFQFRSLGELLNYSTPLAIRNYGPGQLATIAFRGTSALHTAVLWNGLNINQPTLGQTDFSSIAMAGFEEIGIQYGSSSSVTGSDAIGGSILLNSKYNHEKGLQIQLGHQQASFNNFQTQAISRYGKQINKNWHFSGKTLVAKGKMNNNYIDEYRNGYKMSTSATERFGLMQDLFLSDHKQHEISGHIWISDNDLTILPDDLLSRERTHTKAYRTMLKYKYRNWENRISRTRDILDYGKGDYSTMSHAITNKTGFQTSNEWSGTFSDQIRYTIKAGGEITHISTRTTGYGGHKITELRSDIYAMSRFHAGSRWLFSANIRQAFITGYNPPFAPSLGLEYTWLRKNKWNGSFRSSLSRSYRAPTLNERYWEDIGNPNILPEHGWNKEAGIDLSKSLSTTSHLSVRVTGFHQYIQNWTFWNPLKGNRVENVQEVLARGVETEVSVRNKWNQIHAGSTLQYSYTRSSQEKMYDAYAIDVVGKQLPLTPKHTGNWNSWMQFRNLRLTAQVSLTGESFITSEETQPIPGYILLNLFAESVFHSRKFSFRIQPQAYNLTNSFYLDVRRNAMPGRSYSLQLITTFRK